MNNKELVEIIPPTFIASALVAILARLCIAEYFDRYCPDASEETRNKYINIATIIGFISSVGLIGGAICV